MKTYKVIADTTKMNREQWLAMRKNSIGGSEIAAVLGMNRWKTPFQVWAEKTGRIESSVQQSESMYWGIVMESVLREEFAKRTGYAVKEAHYIFASIDNPFMTANIDGYVDLGNGEYAVLEIKTAGNYAESDWNDGCPIEYYLQVQHYLYITGMFKAFIAVLIGGNQFKYIEVDRDEDTIKTIVCCAKQFWNLVQTDTPPAVTDKDNALLAMLYPQSKAVTVKMPDEYKEVLKQYTETKQAIEVAKKAKEAAEAKLKEFMKEADTAVIDGYKISWKTAERNSLSADKVKALLTPDQLKDCTTTTTTRTLRVSVIKTK